MSDGDDQLDGIVAGDADAFARSLAGAEWRLRASLRSFAERVDTEIPGSGRTGSSSSRSGSRGTWRSPSCAGTRWSRPTSSPPRRPGAPLLRRAIEECRARLPRNPGSLRRNTFLQDIPRARRFLAECLRRRGVDLMGELA